MIRHRLQWLALYTPFIPLITIILSIAVTRDWSFVKDALSDLGRPSNGLGAILFNVGLALGGHLFTYPALLVVRLVDPVEAAILFLVSLFMVLVATLNVSFGFVHWLVSLALFLSLAVYVAYNAYKHQSKTLTVLLAASIVAWLLHFVYRIPKGAAIPETISIATAYVCYVGYTLRSAR